MNQEEWEWALARTAEVVEELSEQEGRSKEEILHMLELAIALVRQDPDPRIDVAWDEVPCWGEVPTLVELVAYLGRNGEKGQKRGAPAAE